MNELDVIEPASHTREPFAHLDAVGVRETNGAIPTLSPEQFDQLAHMPEGFSLQSAYLVFENVGDTHRAFFIGFTQMASARKEKPEPITAAQFLWRDPETGSVKRVINAGDNLVKQLSNLPFREGDAVPVEIRFLGKKKSNSGNEFKAFDVIVLNASAGVSVTKPTERQMPISKAIPPASAPVPLPQADITGIRGKIEQQAKVYAGAKRQITDGIDSALFIVLREAAGNNDDARHALNIALTGFESYRETPAHWKLAVWDWLKPYKNGDGKYHANAESLAQIGAILAEFRS